MNDILLKHLQEMIKKIKSKDNTMIIVKGEEGMGMSTCALNLTQYMDIDGKGDIYDK